MSPAQRTELSADWLARLEASASADPWVHSFRLEPLESGATVGSCGFKGPPVESVVEIAYGVAPDQQSKGYATEAAQALVDFAFTVEGVRTVRAHTLPDSSASKRVLAKCGFRHVGEVIDADDGLVWRFERLREDGG